MLRTKKSLKKYFFLTLIFALLLIFGLHIKGPEVWKSKTSHHSLSQLFQNQNQLQAQQKEHSNQLIVEKEDDDEKIKENTSNDDGTDANTFHLIAEAHRQDINFNFKTNYDSEQANSEQRVATETISKSWYFKNGERYPLPVRKRKRKYTKYSSGLFPNQNPHSDRIVNQLMFVPSNYDAIRESGRLKTILAFSGLAAWNVKNGRDVFLRSKCPVDTCEITANRERSNEADMILYKDYYLPTGMRGPRNQVSMLYYLECPYHTHNVKVPDAINWTATYRRDSEIVAPYEKWVYYDPKIRQIEQDRNYAQNKTKKVAWFVSNCGARNGRLQYANELKKHIEVDIYGSCGKLHCPRSTADKCFEILDRDYKFYLAFENSNCRDYITEKFFVNALSRNILPIVMGARPEDYELSSPHRSYIHIDEFASPKELAEYLNILDKDDELYNSYFKWKGTGEFINTFFWCRVCAALHDSDYFRESHYYSDINDWWRGAGVCTNGSWRNYKARMDTITDD